MPELAWRGRPHAIVGLGQRQIIRMSAFGRLFLPFPERVTGIRNLTCQIAAHVYVDGPIPGR